MRISPTPAAWAEVVQRQNALAEVARLDPDHLTHRVEYTLPINTRFCEPGWFEIEIPWGSAAPDARIRRALGALILSLEVPKIRPRGVRTTYARVGICPGGAPPPEPSINWVRHRAGVGIIGPESVRIYVDLLDA